MYISNTYYTNIFDIILLLCFCYQLSGSETLRDIVNRKLCGQKVPFSDELRKFSITLQFYSNKAYNFVRKQFKNVLPHPKTISKWYQVINGQPGFSKEAFMTIKSKAELSTVLCNIVVDEMSIRENIEWDGKNMYGFVDLGTDISIECDDLPHAKNALVFMAVGINGHWKMPLGYFFY